LPKKVLPGDAASAPKTLAAYYFILAGHNMQSDRDIFLHI